MLKNFIVTVTFLFSASLSSAKTYCSEGQACWPTQAEIDQLSQDLDPTARRVLNWAGGRNPRITAVPIFSPNDQPLYGFGVSGLKPLY